MEKPVDDIEAVAKRLTHLERRVEELEDENRRNVYRLRVLAEAVECVLRRLPGFPTEVVDDSQ